MTAAELIEAIQIASGFRDLRNVEVLYDDAEWGQSEILGVEFLPEGGANPRDAIVIGPYVQDIAGDKENR